MSIRWTINYVWKTFDNTDNLCRETRIYKGNQVGYHKFFLRQKCGYGRNTTFEINAISKQFSVNTFGICVEVIFLNFARLLGYPPCLTIRALKTIWKWKPLIGPLLLLSLCFFVTSKDPFFEEAPLPPLNHWPSWNGDPFHPKIRRVV